MSEGGRFVLVRKGRYLIIAAPDPEAPGTWLCELHEPGTPATHRAPHKLGSDGTWALVRKRRGPPDLSVDANQDCRAVRIMRELCPYLREPKSGERVRSFQWNGRLRTLVRPPKDWDNKRPVPEQESGGGVGSADVDVGPGGLAALKPENQR